MLGILIFPLVRSISYQVINGEALMDVHVVDSGGQICLSRLLIQSK